jgi:L-ascorbate metabolism protein UlaG (beta-lactamase superfamily)
MCLLLLGVWAILSGCVTGIGLKYQPDPGLYRQPHRNTITFWGHASSYIDVDGFGIVTDPVFEPAYGMFHKRFIPSPPMAVFDKTDVILISHPHHDHLSPSTLARFPPATRILCPTRSAKYLDEMPHQIITMRPGDVYEFPGGEIIAVAVLHPGYRFSLKARADGRALGYIIRTPEQTLFYSGDSDYFEGFATIGRTYRPDLAILNISTHLRTRGALRVVQDLGVRRVVPSHHGAYAGSNERKGRQYRSELAVLLDSLWLPLAVGESYSLSGVEHP